MFQSNLGTVLCVGTVMKTQLPSASKAKKGTVSIENLEDRGLRLRWRHEGNRYVMALVGVSDNKLNRAAAQSKARQIEEDMVTGNFDPTVRHLQAKASAK